jgi:hypothetical protein
MLAYENIKCINIVSNLYDLIRMMRNIDDKEAKVQVMFLFDDTHEELQLPIQHDFNFDVLYRQDSDHNHIIGIKIFDQNVSDEAYVVTSMLLELFNGDANTVLKLISVKSLMPELTVCESCYLIENITRLNDYWSKLLKVTRNVFLNQEYNFIEESTKIHRELQDTICTKGYIA